MGKWPMVRLGVLYSRVHVGVRVGAAYVGAIINRPHNDINRPFVGLAEGGAVDG
jgi:hypothetical protein